MYKFCCLTPSNVWMQFLWCFVAMVVAMVCYRNWSREVGDCGNTWVPGQVSSQNLVLCFGRWLRRALVLPQSPTYRDQFPLYHKAYKHVFGKFFCFKWRSKLSCCCNILDGATIRTSYNNMISYCWKHVHVRRSHCWGRRLFSINPKCCNNVLMVSLF